MISMTMIVWEKNYEKVLTHHWFLEYKSPLVKEKILLINNVDNIERLQELAKGKDLRLVYIKDRWKTAVKFFNLNMDEKTKGYYYTIPYFVALLCAKQPYLFNVADDLEVKFSDDFLKDSIKELDNNDVLSTTVQFGEDELHSRIEKKWESDKFYHANSMTDCLFIGKVDTLKNLDYNEYAEVDYPLYSGNSFDKRIRMYMINHNKFRGIYKNKDNYYKI